MADDVRVGDRERVEHADDVAEDGLDPIRLHLLRSSRGAEAAQVRRDDAVAGLDQGGALMPPQLGRVGKAVQQQDRVAGAFVDDAEVEIVHSNRSLAHDRAQRIATTEVR